MLLAGLAMLVIAYRRDEPRATYLRAAAPPRPRWRPRSPVKAYLDLLRHVRHHGARKADRTGTGTLSGVRPPDALRLPKAFRWSRPRRST
jgi:hypothetical protein